MVNSVNGTRANGHRSNGIRADVVAPAAAREGLKIALRPNS